MRADCEKAAHSWFINTLYVHDRNPGNFEHHSVL